MRSPTVPVRALAFVTAVTMFAFSGWASADPPSRVARLAYMSGPVSFSPAGEDDWVQATINRPLTTGDRLWADAGGRTEIQVGGATIRMNAATAISVLNLDDRIAQLQLTQGSLNVRVLRLAPDQVFEVDTPNLAFSLRQPGEYRIEADPDGNATTIAVRKGQGEAYGEGASYVIDSRQAYRFTGTGLRDYQDIDAPRADEFDRWASDRDRSYDASVSARYVSPDVIGYQDLDANGTWRVDATYGNVWTPSRVPAGWAPYRDGHWAWVDPWGWTWVDDAPWGFTVSHYGRWANLDGRWGWVPGPARAPAYYAPALVVFVGGDKLQLAVSSGNVGGIAWFPLAPREVYQPSYPVSRGYYENVNRSNTVVNNTVINNSYNTTIVNNTVYVNRQVAGAVVAVPTAAFVQSQPVSKAAVVVSAQMMVSKPLVAVAPVAPTERSVRGAGAQGDKPPPRAFERAVVARSTPPPAHPAFAVQQEQLAAKPGHPLDDTARKELKPAAASGQATIVKVVVPIQNAQPSLPPPRIAPGPKPGNSAAKPEERKVPEVPAVPAAAVQPLAVQQVPPPVAVTRPPEQSDKPPQHGPAVAPQAAPPQPAKQAAAPPQLQVQAQPAVHAPIALSAEPRSKPEQGGRGEQQGPPSPPPGSPQRAAEPKVIAPQVSVPAPRAPAPTLTAPKDAAPLQVVPPASVPRETAQPAKPEPAPAARQAPPEPGPPAAAAVKQPAAATQPTPKVEQHPQGPKPAVGKPDEKKNDAEEQKREEESRKQKG